MAMFFCSAVSLTFSPSLFFPFSTRAIVRPTVEYATPVWSCALTSAQAITLDRLQAAAARSCLRAKTGRFPDWQTSKENLNSHRNWESIAWRRHILGLAYFHHVYYCRYSLLHVNSFKKSRSSHHPHFLILPVAGSYISHSFLFMFAIA